MFTCNLGDGLELRMLEMRHAPELLEFVSKNRSYLGSWLDWGHTMITVEDAQHFIRRGITRFAEDGLPRIGIWLHGQMVGGVLFFPIEPEVRATEIGYWLGQEVEGRGVMTRTLLRVLQFVFEDLQLNRVGLQAEVDNTRSRALAERLGFTFEGVRRQTWIHDERLVDMAGYSLLASEWRRRKAQL